ncbi:YD repeat-containing protein [Azomonas agilis]|uniref:YD repeat-containing protein n=1 Tax=Azomonas agilis TaxID=116849 RepID=A0A562J019_9GAMM|nr:RHS repeat protein [Azomonas agilis]TWH76526.1 YD repeat-containing protein [Azomonas agilis]
MAQRCKRISGKACSITDASGNTQYTYDTAGRLKTQVSKINGVNYTLTYAYDSYSRLQSLTYPGGNKITYEYNNWSQVSKVSGLIGGVQKTIATIEQQPLRPIHKVTFGNGVVRQYSYDTNDRLTGISSPSIQGLGFSYNNNNQITAVTNSINAALPQQLFGYDEVGRLGSVTSSAGDQSWTFDANGNRETHTWGGAVDDYVPNSGNNRIPTITGSRAKNFTFDSLGNTTAKSGYGGNQSYTYDAFDRMSSVTHSGGTTYYANNGLNQRSLRPCRSHH